MLENFGIVGIEWYITSVIAVIVAPGPNSLFVLSTSLKFGVKKGYKAALGVFFGDSLLMLMVYVGIASLIHKTPMLYNLMRYCGALFLIYLAGQIIYGTFFAQARAQDTIVDLSKNRIFSKALALSLTNPKALLFFFSLFPAFMDASYKPTFIPFLILAGILQCTSFLYLSCLIFSGVGLVKFVKQHPWLATFGNVLVACIFVGFSLKLALF